MVLTEITTWNTSDAPRGPYVGTPAGAPWLRSSRAGDGRVAEAAGFAMPLDGKHLSASIPADVVVMG